MGGYILYLARRFKPYFSQINIMEHIVSKKVSPIPRGYRTATTCLTVYDVDSAVAFYQAAFAAELLTRHSGADEAVAIHATIKIGNSIIALSAEAPEQGLLSPASLGVCSHQVHLYLDDVDTSWERAVEAGAQVHTPLYDAYWGDRSGILMDGNGYLWSMASKIENVSHEEVARRSRAWYQVDVDIPAEVEVPVAAMMAEETLAEDNVAV
jgi:PhnB protein